MFYNAQKFLRSLPWWQVLLSYNCCYAFQLLLLFLVDDDLLKNSRGLIIIFIGQVLEVEMNAEIG
jgi:hypothetical protein